jgi:hypothetical protein
MREEQRMTVKVPTTDGRRPSVLVFLTCLATVHCNAVLGIHEAGCFGECDEAGARAGAVADEELQPSDGVPAANASDAGGPTAPSDTGLPTSLEGMLPTTDAGSTGLVGIIASACADQVAGRPFCVVNQRVVCSEEGAPASVEACADAEHCLRGTGPYCASCSEADDGACGRPVCAPRQRRCQGRELQVCNADGSGFVLEQECADELSCDADAGCTVAECTPNQRRCRGEALEVCDSTGTFVVLEQCARGTTCSADQGCVGGVCAANERRCRGANLQQCNEAGTRFETIQRCGKASQCDEAAARCIE